MQNIILVVHLLLALLLIGAVLLQRSEGGALGIGGGGNIMSGRGAATALQKATWGLAAAFIVTSLTLTFFAIEQARDRGLGLGGASGGAANLNAPLPDARQDGGLLDLALPPEFAAPTATGTEETTPAAPSVDLPSAGGPER